MSVATTRPAATRSDTTRCTLCGASPSLRDLSVFRGLPGEDDTHFLTLMTFDDWAAVEAFAGHDTTASVIPPAARALLARHDAHSQHFELRAATLPEHRHPAA